VALLRGESILAGRGDNFPPMPNRPVLREIPLSDVKVGPGVTLITIDVDAWDAMIADVYKDGGILLEIVDEKPVRAFRK
jgi:hypothetical protein